MEISERFLDECSLAMVAMISCLLFRLMPRNSVTQITFWVRRGCY